MGLKVDIEFYRKTYLSGRTPWPSDTPEPPFRDFLRLVRDKLRGRKGLSPFILDIGCGEGRHLLLAKEVFPRSFVFGFDIIKEPLYSARNRIIGKKNIFLCQGNAFFIPFKSSSFDVVIDFGVFHHVRRKDVPRYKKEVLRVLKPSGFFLIGVFSVRFKHYPGERRKKDFVYHRGHYDRFFTKRRLREEFRELRVLEMKEWGSGIEWFIYGLFQR